MIEIDITSYTNVNDYLAYKVPEVWLFKSEVVTICCLEGDRYQVKNSSRYFPDMEVLDLIDNCFKVASERNTSAAIRQLRQKLSQN